MYCNFVEGKAALKMLVPWQLLPLNCESFDMACQKNKDTQTTFLINTLVYGLSTKHFTFGLQLRSVAVSAFLDQSRIQK